MTEKLMTIFGTRPEIIRLSRLIPKLDRNFDHKIINTFQNHLPQLNDIFTSELKIRKPDYNLDISHKDYGHEIVDIISQTYEILKKEKPDKLLVLGDTYSCLSVLPASNLGIKIYHMEAGMRSGDWRMPEEKNRKIVDNLANINLAYTENSRKNLIAEGFDPKKTFVTGNPIIEVLNDYATEINNSTILKRLELTEKKYFLVTIHRVENISDAKTMKSLVTALEKIYKIYKNKMIVLAHPRFVEGLSKFNIKINPKIRLRKNCGFFDFVKLQKWARCVLTDSGTVPEECAYLKVPCITLRSSTERQELVDLGTNIIAGTNWKSILDAVEISMYKQPDWDWEKSLGDGRTSERVLRIIKGVL